MMGKIRHIVTKAQRHRVKTPLLWRGRGSVILQRRYKFILNTLTCGEGKRRYSLISKLSVLLILIMNMFSAIPLKAQTRLSDIVEIQNAQETKLIGYGLVAGLNRTGDRSMSQQGTVFTVQSIANMLKNFGINVDPQQLRTRNIAAVMVTATITPFNAPGSQLDVTVSSLGDASSLKGGVLLQTPLINPIDKKVYAYSQGPLLTGGVSAEITGASLSRNQSMTATIPGGATVVNNAMYTPDHSKPLGLVLLKPDFTNAMRIGAIINKTFKDSLAHVRNAGLINIDWPKNDKSVNAMNLFTSQVLDLQIETDAPARVVINERTGTIVAGGNVMIGSVLISHGNIQIQTQSTPFVSQPAPFSNGTTIKGQIPQVGIQEQSAKNFVIKSNTRVTDLAQMLTNLGLLPRDIIAIFQAIDKAGALKGKLVIM